MSKPEVKAWQCAVCGYIHREDEPPDECPICGADKSDFEPYFEEEVVAAVTNAKNWRCLNCTYIFQGDEPPDQCPVCGADKDRFEPIEPEEISEGKSAFSGHLLVVGAGIAGLSAVESFRQYNNKAKVTLLSKETFLPYYRLNLTRYLAGDVSDDELAIYPQQWFSDRDIELKAGCEATQIDADKKTVTLDCGENITYDRMILANGAHPFVPPITGSHREGFTVLRTVEQAKDLKKSMQPGKKCVVIGGGLLGLEIAGALVKHDADVTLLEAHEWLMPRQLNQNAAELLRQHVESLKINVLYQARTKEIKGDERVSEVLLEDGRTVPCDQVVLCTGVRPNSYLARKMGLDVNHGIVVNNLLQTSVRDIYAAGDVAEHHGVLYGNWSASQFQGNLAGMNAAGIISEFGGIPRSNTLKVLGIDLLSIGQFEPQDGSYKVLETRVDKPYYRFVFHDTHLVGAVLVGDAGNTIALKKAIQDRRDFSEVLSQDISASDFAAKLNAEH